MTYNDIQVGDSASFGKMLSETDVYSFACNTGDFNPVHINQRYAKQSKFGQRIAHGMLTGSLFSTIFGTSLPGPGTIYISQQMEFMDSVLSDDTVKGTVPVEEKMEKGRVRFNCVATTQRDGLVVSGSAVLRPPCQ